MTLEIRIHDSVTPKLLQAFRHVLSGSAYGESAVAWTNVVTSAYPNLVDAHYILVYSDDEPLAFGILHIFRGLEAAEFIGGITRQIMKALSKVGLHPLKFNIGFLEIPFCNKPGLIFSNHVEPSARARVIAKIVPMLRQWGGMDALCIKSESPAFEIREQLSSQGLVELPFIDNTTLSFPYASFEDYLQSRSGNRRRRILKDIRTADEAGVDLKVVPFKSQDFIRINEMFQATVARNLQKGELPLPIPVGIELFQELSAQSDEQFRMILATQDGLPVGFAILIQGTSTLFVNFLGVDYDRGIPSRIYFNLFYEALREAARTGSTAVDLGATSYDFKDRLGCERIATQYHITFYKTWMRPLGPLLRSSFAKSRAAT